MNSQSFKFYNKLITIFILLSTWQLKAQETYFFFNEGKPKSTYSVAFLSNGLIKNPGVNFRYERPISLTITDTPKRKIKELNLNGNLGFYWDPYTHVAAYATAGFLYRKTNKRNRQKMIAINPLGYMRTFTHETYEVDDNLNVDRKRLAGRSYFAPELILGIGKLKENRARFFNVHFMFLRKYNLGPLPLINFEFGYRF